MVRRGSIAKLQHSVRACVRVCVPPPRIQGYRCTLDQQRIYPGIYLLLGACDLQIGCRNSTMLVPKSANTLRIHIHAIHIATPRAAARRSLLPSASISTSMYVSLPVLRLNTCRQTCAGAGENLNGVLMAALITRH